MISTARRFLLVVPMVILAVAGLLFSAAGTGAAAPSVWRYTMVAFGNDSDRDMDVYESGDGTDFTALQTAAYRPPSGVVRDASIFRHTDGMYYVTYTTGGGANIGFARSSDRVNWTFLQNFPIPFCCAFLPGTGAGTGSASPSGFSGSAGFSDGPSLSPFTTKAWAPEWFVEGDRVSVIVSLSTGGGFVPYLMTALDPGLRMWSFPDPFVGIGADHIDTTVVKVGPTYHAFTKNETHKVIEHWTAPSSIGPYTLVPSRDFGPLKEGPTVIELPDGTWRLYYDDYTNRKYFYSDSTDGLNTWSEPRELPGVSDTVRHVGVMREPA